MLKDEVDRQLQIALLEAYNFGIAEAARLIQKTHPELARLIQQALLQRDEKGRLI